MAHDIMPGGSVREQYGRMPSGAPVAVDDGRGFVPAGKLSAGDRVFDASGNPVRVKFARPASSDELYRAYLADGSYFLAAGGTCVPVRDRNGYFRNCPSEWVPVSDLAAASAADDRGRHAYYIQSVRAVRRSDAALPVPPYLAGLVFSAGYCADGMPAGPVVFRTMDRAAVLTAGALAGYTDAALSERHDGYCLFYVLDGERRYLTFEYLAAAVPECRFFSTPKAARAIPPAYAYAGAGDRRALLQGLMDGAGWIDVRHGMTCRFMQGEMVLARCVAELAWSLGMSCSVEHRFRDGAPVYRADFRVGDADKILLFHSDARQKLVRSGRRNQAQDGRKFGSKALSRVVPAGRSVFADDAAGAGCTELFLDWGGRSGPATVLTGVSCTPVLANRG